MRGAEGGGVGRGDFAGGVREWASTSLAELGAGRRDQVAVSCTPSPKDDVDHDASLPEMFLTRRLREGLVDRSDRRRAASQRFVITDGCK